MSRQGTKQNRTGSALLNGALVLLWSLGYPLHAAEAGAAAIAPLRISLSEKIMPGVNTSDARAAFLIWTQELVKDTDLRIAPNQEWIRPSDQLLSAIRSGQVDLFGITVQEYRQVAPFVDASRLMAQDSAGDQLVLLAREGSGINRLADLRGKSMLVLDVPNASLAEVWLAVILRREGLDFPKQLLGRVAKSTKLAQVVLPVFFGQADACVVTRGGLNTMFELNPQLGQRLKILQTSPMLASGFLAWRKDYPANLKKPMLERLLQLKTSPTAKQVLTLFQSTGYATHDVEYLRGSLELLDANDRYEKAAGGVR